MRPWRAASLVDAATLARRPRMFGSKGVLDRMFGGLQRRQRLDAGEIEKPSGTEKGTFLLSRRSMVAAAAGGVAAATAAAHAASFGNPDEPPQGAVNVRNPASLT